MASKDGTKVYKEKKHADRRESFVCGACGQLGHMRTNKNCPKYGEEAEPLEIESTSGRSHLPDSANRSQMKVLNKKMISSLSREVAEEAPETLEKQGMELQVKVPPLKFKCGSSDKLSEKNSSVPQMFDRMVSSSMNNEAKQYGKSLIIPVRLKGENVQPDTPKPTVRIRPPQGTMDREPPKKIVIKQPKITTNKHSKDFDGVIDQESRKMKKIAELLPSFEKRRMLESQLFVNDESGSNHGYERRIGEEKGRRNIQRLEEERTRRMIEESRNYEAAMREEFHAKKKKSKKSKKKKPDFNDDYLIDHKPYRTGRRFPERDRAAKRPTMVDIGFQDYATLPKRRKVGEVELSNILETIVDQLRENIEISYLFIKPVTKKEAPDYFDVIQRPMDLSTIRDKVRNMAYKSREQFRHDVWQIAFNAHRYNDRRNPLIPPLADQLLELCDYLIHDKDDILTDAEAGVSSSNL